MLQSFKSLNLIVFRFSKKNLAPVAEEIPTTRWPGEFEKVDLSKAHVDMVDEVVGIGRFGIEGGKKATFSSGCSCREWS